jgi:hypothetical protein
MPVVNHMAAHPGCECHVVRDEVQIISPLQKTGGMCLFSGIDEANGEMIQMFRRWSRPHLPGRNRIAAQQKVLSLLLKLEGTHDSSLHHSMSPFDLPFRSASKHSELGYFENVSELRLEQLADCGFAHPASACDEKKHTSSL